MNALATYVGSFGIVGFGKYLFFVGAMAAPGASSWPAALSSFQRLRLMSDHLLVALRGVTLIA